MTTKDKIITEIDNRESVTVQNSPVGFTWQDYFEIEKEEIIESIRAYEQYGNFL